METAVDAKGCFFEWKIANLNRWNWLKMNQKITSPVFVANAFGKTKWAFELYQSENNEFVGVNLHRKGGEYPSAPRDIEVNYEIVFNTFKKVRNVSGYEFDLVRAFVNHKEFFYTKRNSFFPEDTLTVECTLWRGGEKPERLDRLFHTTVIEVKRRCFLWKIDKPLDLKSELQIDFDHSKFCLYLKKDLSTMKLHLIRFDNIVKYMSLGISIIVPEEGREICSIHENFCENVTFHQFPLPNEMRNGQYFSDDVLTFHLELVLLNLQCGIPDRKMHTDLLINQFIGNDESPSTDIPIPDPNLLYDKTSKDIELRTPTKTFTAHKAILSAVSDKFRNMFLTNREESINGFDDDTVEEMLKYIYTGSLEDLSYERACKLHAISNYYGILSLKSLCFSFLQKKLCQENACKILVLADEYNDADLKTAVRKYIVRYHKPLLQSPQWKDLMKHHKLTAYLMHSFLRTE